MPLVSIIIPVFNGAAYLGEAIGSALAQTHPETEVIVVDDGSADESLAIARRFAAPNLRVVTQKNRGASAARNRGLAEARGSYVQFLDADDALALDKIAVQLAAFAGRTDRLVSGRWTVFRGSPKDGVFADEIMYHDATPVDWLVEAWTCAGMMQPGAWLTPRSLIDHAGPWNEKLSLDDDGEYFCRVMLAGQAVVFAPAANIYYRSHEGPRVSATRGERGARSLLRSCELKEKTLLAREDSPRTRRACATNYVRCAWEHYPEGSALVDQALAHARRLDRSVRMPTGGRREALLAKLLGWRFARRLQKSWSRRGSAHRR